MYKKIILHNKKNIGNLTIRIVTLALRFSTLIILANYVSPSEVGNYGLIASGVAFSLYLIGIDFYTYANREMLASPIKTWGGKIKSQALLSLLMYTIFIAIMYLLVLFNQINIETSLWICSIAAIEYLAQELTRLHIIMNDQLFSTILVFIRHGAWVPFMLLTLQNYEKSRNLNTPLTYWCIFGIISITISIYRLRISEISNWGCKINTQWISNGIKTSLLYFSGTLSIKSIQTFDRTLFLSINDSNLLGTYVLFFSISLSLITVLEAGLISFNIPKLVTLESSGNDKEVNFLLKSLLKNTKIICVVFAISSILATNTIVRIIENSIYKDNIDIFYILLLASIMYSLSLIPHYVLYAKKKDIELSKSQHLSALIFFLSTPITMKIDLRLSIPISVLIGFSSIYFLKTHMVRKLNLLKVNAHT